MLRSRCLGSLAGVVALSAALLGAPRAHADDMPPAPPAPPVAPEAPEAPLPPIVWPPPTEVAPPIIHVPTVFPPAPLPPAPLTLELLAPPAAAPPLAPPAAPLPPAPQLICGTVMPGRCCTACVPWCRRLTLEGHASLLDDPEGPPTGISSGLANALDWNALDFGLGYGGRVAYEFSAFYGWTARLAGTFWGTWDDDELVTGTLGSSAAAGGAVLPSPLLTNVPLASESTLWDVEASLWSACVQRSCWCAAWGWGLRYVSLEEESNYSFTTANRGAGVSTAGVAAEAKNSLLAAQFGGRLGWCLSPRFEATAEANAFAGWRQTKREVRTTGFGPPSPLPAAAGGSVTDDEFGFGATLDLALRWKVCPSWSLRVGYGLLVLFDQARSFELVDFSATATGLVGPKASEDTVLVHRVFLGIEFNF